MQKQNDIFFSVIIPFYNVGEYLEEAIGSVISQTFERWELILIDDGSKDNSFKIAQEYCDLDPRIQLFFHEGNCNKGVSSSRNLGIEKAKGEWISFLDGDDFWIKEKLEIEKNAIEIELNSEIVFMYSKTQKINQKGENLMSFGFGKPGLTKNAFENTIKGIFCHTSNFVVNRKIIFQNNILFKENMRYAEDTLFFHECLLFGNLYFINQELTFFRINDSSATNFILNGEKNAGRMAVYLELLKKADSKYNTLISNACVKVGFLKILKVFIRNPFGNFKLLFITFFKILFHPKIPIKIKLKMFVLPFLNAN